MKNKEKWKKNPHTKKNWTKKEKNLEMISKIKNWIQMCGVVTIRGSVDVECQCAAWCPGSVCVGSCSFPSNCPWAEWLHSHTQDHGRLQVHMYKEDWKETSNIWCLNWIHNYNSFVLCLCVAWRVRSYWWAPYSGLLGSTKDAVYARWEFHCFSSRGCTSDPGTILVLSLGVAWGVQENWAYLFPGLCLVHIVLTATCGTTLDHGVLVARDEVEGGTDCWRV